MESWPCQRRSSRLIFTKSLVNIHWYNTPNSYAKESHPNSPTRKQASTPRNNVCVFPYKNGPSFTASGNALNHPLFCCRPLTCRFGKRNLNGQNKELVWGINHETPTHIYQYKFGFDNCCLVIKSSQSW